MSTLLIILLVVLGVIVGGVIGILLTSWLIGKIFGDFTDIWKSFVK